LADENTPRVQLSDVSTDEQKILRIIDGFSNRDVWRNLDQTGPIEQKGRFIAKFISGYYQGHLIHDANTDEEYGFFLLNCGRLKSQGRVEVDIAIPKREHRKLGVSKLAFVALFDHWLLEERCAEMWGWIDVGNRASVKMIEALQIPVYNETRRVIADEETVDVIEVHMTRENWERVRPKLASAWGL
jgi:hypothetical protein